MTLIELVEALVEFDDDYNGLLSSAEVMTENDEFIVRIYRDEKEHVVRLELRK